MNIRVKFAELNQTFTTDTRFAEKEQVFKVSFGSVQHITKYVGGELYAGDYTVTPKIEEQEMQTKGKVMTENIMVKSIPFFNVSNTSGGSTVYIGNEV